MGRIELWGNNGMGEPTPSTSTSTSSPPSNSNSATQPTAATTTTGEVEVTATTREEETAGEEEVEVDVGVGVGVGVEIDIDEMIAKKEQEEESNREKLKDNTAAVKRRIGRVIIDVDKVEDDDELLAAKKAAAMNESLEQQPGSHRVMGSSGGSGRGGAPAPRAPTTSSVDDLARELVDDINPLPASNDAAEESRPGAFSVVTAPPVQHGTITSNNAITTTTTTSTLVAAEGGEVDVDDIEQGRRNNNNNTTQPTSAAAPITARLAPPESSSGGDHHQQRRTSAGGAGGGGGGEAAVTERPLVDAHVVKDDEGLRRGKVIGAVVVLLAIIILLVLGIAGVFSSSNDDDIVMTTTGGEANETPEIPSIPSADADVDDTMSTTETTAGSNTTTTTNTNDNNMKNIPLLQQIRERGYLECAYNAIPFMMSKDEITGIVGGVNSVWCKAIAAAIWGDQDKLLEVDADDEFAINDILQRRMHYHDYIPYGDDGFVERDVHATSFTHTMHRETVKSQWRAFSTPYYYDGARVGGTEFYVDCVENKGFKHIQECSDLMLCVMAESTPLVYAQSRMTDRHILTYVSPVDAILDFVNGTCNAFLMESLGVAEGTVRYFGYKGDDYATGVSMYSKEPIAVVTPQSDTQFADFVDAIVHATLVAEQYNITQATAHLFPTTQVFGDDYQNMFANVIHAVGNYDEIYTKYLESDFPREPVNQLNNGTTGLMYSHPFGDLSASINPEDDYNQEFGPNLHRVFDRQKVLCGVRGNRPGFVDLDNKTGLDIDFCRAVAASLFGGDIDAMDLVEVSNQQEGFQMLANGTVDLVAGATWNLVNDVNETSTGLGFDFSQPYFFGFSPEEDNFCLAVREDDHDWATYIYWIVAATIYAEEHGYSSNTTSNSMPEVLVYGNEHRRMFRDTILAVGNYGDMYRRNVEPIISRSGRNLLNGGPLPGPQHYPMPGLI